MNETEPTTDTDADVEPMAALLAELHQIALRVDTIRLAVLWLARPSATFVLNSVALPAERPKTPGTPALGHRSRQRRAGDCPGGWAT
jgi:hypothetical protein